MPKSGPGDHLSSLVQLICKLYKQWTALERGRKGLLCKTLMELGEEDFKFFTDLPQRVLETPTPVDIADELVKKHGSNALKETVEILVNIGNNNLAEKLRSDMLKLKGASCFSVNDDDQITRLKADLQENLQRLYSFASDGNTKRWQQQPLADVYMALDVAYEGDVSPDERHEVLQMETRAEVAKKPILLCDIFKTHGGKERPIRTLLTVGFAGIGKTFLVQKFVCDWASGNTNQDVLFLFPLAFRELNTDEGKSFTLAELIQRYVCESRHMSKETLNNIFAYLQTSEKRDYESSRIKILFILDGLDECKFKMDLKNEIKVDMDVTEAYPLEILLAHLIKRNLLPCARVWITTRPATARDIPSNLIDSRTEVRGFSDSQRLEYFRKRFPNEEHVIEHIQVSRSIFIMCHMPIFCWLTATVIQDHLDKEKGELPETLTNMFSKYVFRHLENSKERETTEYIGDVKALARLAFHHTMSRQQIFYEKDLVDSGFDHSQAAKHCGIFTNVFKEVRPLRRNLQGKLFQFIHLTIQEYMAALYVMMSLFHDNKNVLADSELVREVVFQEEEESEETESEEEDETESEEEGKTESEEEDKTESEEDVAIESEETEEDEGDWKITDVHRFALQKASESEGNLDLFLRFLLGLSLPCNQELVGELLKAPQDYRQSKSKTVALIKERLKRNPPEKNVNMIYCLDELEDDSLLKQFWKERESRGFRWSKMTNDMWSALAAYIMMDADIIFSYDLVQHCLCSFELGEYCRWPLGLKKLLVVVKASQESILSDCRLDKGSCHLLSSILSSPSNLRCLDLGNKILLKGLASPHCILESLRLLECGITAKGWFSLAEALKLYPSYLEKLNLSENVLLDEGVEILSKGLASPNCNLKILRLKDCGITDIGCISLVEALKLNAFHLQELDLSKNKLLDEGVEILSKELASPNFRLKILDLDNCGITDIGCVSLAEALKLNTFHLQELRLGRNDLLHRCMFRKKGWGYLAEALKLNPSHLQELHVKSYDAYFWGKQALDHISDPSFRLLVNKHPNNVAMSDDRKTTGYRRYGQSGMPLLLANNNLALNTTETKEVIIDFGRNSIDPPPLYINGGCVERVNTFRFLGVQISDDLSWTANITAIIKKAQPRLRFLRILRKNKLERKPLLAFYHSSIESLLTSCISTWYRNCTAADRERPQRTVQAAQRIIG
ncbi:protein NLRC3-like [Corythoichthys intestinalis]|uniref:protein NLRC3-like n=1 Tax=Corythoichthys intestinalis TaxID=161448 RepID=UPI0025A5F02D|nr:protein NLRC3-like [Corythoichthys intestinalis]